MVQEERFSLLQIKRLTWNEFCWQSVSTFFKQVAARYEVRVARSKLGKFRRMICAASELLSKNSHTEKLSNSILPFLLFNFALKYLNFVLVSYFCFFCFRFFFFLKNGPCTAEILSIED